MTKNQLKNTLLKARDAFLTQPHERSLIKVWTRCYLIEIVAIHVGRRVTFAVRLYKDPENVENQFERLSSIPFTSLVAAEKNFRDTYLGL